VLLAKPIHRAEFVLGKYVGLVLTLLVNTGVMAVVFFALLMLKGMADPAIGLAIVMLYMEFLLVTALAILFSCLSNPIISCILTLALYVIGHLVWSLDLLRTRVDSGAAKAACIFLSRVLPNLAPFDIKGQVVQGIPINSGAVGFAAAYLFLYGGAVLALACATFQRKELQ